MSQPIENISLLQLCFAFIPVLMGLAFLYFWQVNIKRASYALLRMLTQLLLIGYFLNYLFNAESSLTILTILIAMVAISSWIALGNTKIKDLSLLKHIFTAIALSGGFTLLIITQGVLNLVPWYQPQVLIPLAGMIFANCMNSISLCSERLYSELETGKSYRAARDKAMNAAIIPVINSLFAVGLVSLPGMMTGQILSGISPLIAARYQIIVMCMIFASSILSAGCFLILRAKNSSSAA